jgi:hypothetical protein
MARELEGNDPPQANKPRGRGRSGLCVISERPGADTAVHAFYRRAMKALNTARVPFLVGGAYAFECYTGINRRTKDFDLFVRPADRDRALAALAAAGCQTMVKFPHWLAKAYQGDDFVDLIYGSGNGCTAVDEEWFAHSVDAIVLKRRATLCPPEEMLWSKAFIMERERYDGADIAHLIHTQGDHLDWSRLLRRFGANWRVLLSSLVLYGFIYPFDRDRVPAEVLTELLERLQREQTASASPASVCQGTLLSREQYLVDLEQWGYRDARLTPRSTMQPADVAVWTAAIHEDE